MRSDLLFELRGNEVLDVGDGVLAAVEHHVPDLVLDAVFFRLEQALGDDPGLEQSAADDAVDVDALHDGALEVLNLEVSLLESEQHHVAAAAYGHKGIVDGRVVTRHFHGHVDAVDAAELDHLLDDVGIGFPSVVLVGLNLELDYIVRTEFARELRVHRVGIDTNDARRAQRFRDHDGELPDGAAAEDGHALAAQVDRRRRVHGIAEGLLHHGHFRANLARVGAPQNARGQLDVLGKSAVLRNADDFLVHAHVTLSDQALVAASAHDV